MTDFLETYYQHYYRFLPTWIGSLTSFLVTYRIVSSMGGTFVESMIAGIFSGIISGVIVWWSTYKFMKNVENKKIHRKDIVFDVLKKFKNMDISYDEQNHNFSMIGMRELRDKKIYKYTLEHLKAYQLILDNWNKSNNLIEDINNNSDKLKGYIFDKIKKDIGEEYKKLLSHPIQFILREAVQKDIKKSVIKTEVGSKYIHVSLDGELWTPIHYKTLSKTKINKFLTNLGDDTKFQDELIDIQGNYKDANEVFYNKFKPELKKLLDNIDGREEDLKGKCEGCSYLVKWFGDC